MRMPSSHLHDLLWTFFSQMPLFPNPDPVSAFIQDALLAAAEPESAVSDLLEHERQCSPSPATKQPLHPHQYQLQHAGQGLPQQQGSEAPIPR